MGRGRAKAKQTKVARDLKYNSAPSTDLSRLAQELASSPSSERIESLGQDDEDEDLDDDRRAAADC